MALNSTFCAVILLKNWLNSFIFVYTDKLSSGLHASCSFRI